MFRELFLSKIFSMIIFLLGKSGIINLIHQNSIMEFLKELIYFLKRAEPTFVVLLFLVICFLFLYLIILILLYFSLIKRIWEKNNEMGVKHGILIIHSFSYSWKKGVTLNPTNADHMKPPSIKAKTPEVKKALSDVS